MALNWLSKQSIRWKKTSKSASPLMQYDIWEPYYRPKSSATANRPNEPQPIASGICSKLTDPTLAPIGRPVSNHAHGSAAVASQGQEEGSAFPILSSWPGHTRIWRMSWPTNSFEYGQRITIQTPIRIVVALTCISTVTTVMPRNPLTRSKQVRNLKELTNGSNGCERFPSVDESFGRGVHHLSQRRRSLSS